MKQIAQFSSYGAVAVLALVTLALLVYGGLFANGLKVTLIQKVYADVPYLQSGYTGGYSQASYSGGTCSETGGRGFSLGSCRDTYSQSSYGGFGYSQSSYFGGGGGGGGGDFIRPCDNGDPSFTVVGEKMFENGRPTAGGGK